MKKNYIGTERRKFKRLDFAIPLDYKICKEETVSKLLEGYTVNVSESGLLCSFKSKVNRDDILWLMFDRATLNFCEEMEKRVLIYQNGILGKVVRIKHKGDGSYNVGIQFITREEKNLTNIYPKIHFLTKDVK
ncbi:MAG: PilZ domain-containing protein [Candidatus Omnitrophica bacterium]|nr:PilZ domain-containing protein [Candidatus Omnitrophota bacterium]MDD5238437.1 PilZ domain-containing protein [Candidatus Omnitrophota bacterium]